MKFDKDYIFVIYSCKKNLKKANGFYDRFHEYVEKYNFKMFVMYGDDTIKSNYEIKDDKYLILKVDDTYDFLYLKTLKLFKIVSKIFPKIKGCFKCDDDIILNTICFLDLVRKIPIFNIDYSGYTSISIASENNDFHCKQKNSNFSKQIKTPNALYCGGPLYYLSNKSMKIISNVNEKDFDKIYYEDLMIGYILNRQNIFPIDSRIYSDDIDSFKSDDRYGYSSYHNAEHKNILFIKIHGGLGNQMFQIASGMGIAKKNKMNYCIINSSNESKHHFTHTNDNNFFIKSVFKTFPSINSEYINIKNTKCYKENTEYSFIHNDIILDEDTFLDGYFQNPNYFLKYKDTIIEKFISNSIYEHIENIIIGEDAEFKQQLKDSYFIHVRRGDYVNNQFHELDYDSYYKKAISYILDKEKDAHFFIISDDIEYCQTYSIFDNINKSFFDPGMEHNSNVLSSLYLMSFCHKGGICCNSSFSWWGSYLNKNQNKIVLFPSKWVNKDLKIDKHLKIDIYYEKSIVIDF
jgi:hypothetical protein